ncbi:hypothetical protein IE4771_CH02605 [Rhizobium etli bv. mimosae str. IE4771]|uniref:Uncharacterized protein n=1 Tax=Rhizobium etli bv. mimosae str. IE4771 TaxID=1432050 RepID=A0A060I709_RHIET|nr:hypothetical protein IE4771_CH02605 [Rhizobium sp. IE4771]
MCHLDRCCGTVSLKRQACQGSNRFAKANEMKLSIPACPTTCHLICQQRCSVTRP